MPTPTIPNGETQFFVSKYEGNGGGQRVGKFVPFTDSGTIANSCIFDASSNVALYRTPSGAGNRKTFTVSVWAKRCVLTDASGNNTYGQRIFNVGTSSAWFDLKWSGSGDTEGANRLHIREYSGSAEQIEYWTNRTFLDTSKWYHILLVVDTTQSTSTDRIKLYVDGDQITSWYRSNAPSLNFDTQVSSTVLHNIGRFTGATSNNLSGYLAEFNFVDGQALLPASFGETDTSTGRWVPSTVRPYPTTTTTFTVTVADASGNKYFIDSSQQATVTLIEGATYRFDQSDSSNAGHPLRFSTTSNGTNGGGTEFTSGVTTAGTPGSSGAYTEITVPTGTATLYYYCTNHSGMGGTANTQDQYGTNGFRLQFQTSSALGDDSSGNTNDLAYTNLSASDQTTDSPTSNFATFDPNFSSSSMVLSEGNLTVTDNANANYESAYVGMPVQSGKYYFEITIDVAPSFLFLGVNNSSSVTANKNQYPGYADGSASFLFHTSADYVYYGNNGGNYYTRGSSTTLANGDKVGVAYDADTGAFWVAKNNSWLYSGNPSTGANPLFTGYTPKEKVYFSTASWYSTVKQSYNFGQKSFTYTPPTDFVSLNQDNLQTTEKGITGMVWIKNRDEARSHVIYDSSRGAGQKLQPDKTNADTLNVDGVTKFLKGGVAVGSQNQSNDAGDGHVAWNWTANGGTTSTNTDGSITSTVQANTDAGFSIVQYTGTGSNATVGHGLSSAPEWILIKDTGNAESWIVSHKGLTSQATYSITLNNTNAESSGGGSTYWNNTAPTSSVFSLATDTGVNGSSRNYVAYCWHGVDGFSKFGKYTGNGSSDDGPFIYTGFKPAFLMYKGINSASQWDILDNKRNPFNPQVNVLSANLTNADRTPGSYNSIDFLSNGFKIRALNDGINKSGDTFIYMSFASHPFTGDGVSPATAR